MKIDKFNKLFFVEFGKPDVVSGYISFGTVQPDPLFVIASSYDEAAQKALNYIESKQEIKSVITPDGSLNLDNINETIQIKSIKVASDQIVY